MKYVKKESESLPLKTSWSYNKNGVCDGYCRNQKRLHKADKIYYYIVWVLSSEWNDQNQNIV